MAEHAHHHVSPDDQYLETPPGAGYEHTDASVWIMVKFGFWLLVAAVLVHIGLGGMYEGLIRQNMATTEPQYPLAVGQPVRQAPAPRLQQFPANEIYEFRLSEERELRSYGWVNKDAGIVRIPVGEAKRALVQRGLPVVTVDPANPEAVPGMMPTDASSGRVTERRRQ